MQDKRCITKNMHTKDYARTNVILAIAPQPDSLLANGGVIKTLKRCHYLPPDYLPPHRHAGQQL